MKVLSLFDGMSCGYIALTMADKLITTYFASEIDKYAIKASKVVSDKIVQMGDVVNVRKMAENGFFGHIDLLIGGSPCQGFSFAGKQLAFDDPRSALFFEYVKILEALKKTNPNIKFLLENVKMKKEHLAVISEQLGVEPIFINSALVSAQNRQRYYWCNWKVKQPEDKHIYLKDIIETGNVDREKSYTIDANYHKGGSPEQYFDKSRRQLVFTGGRMTGRYLVDGKRADHTVESMAGLTEQRIEVREDGKSNCLTSVQKDSLVVLEATKKGFVEIPPNCGVDLTFPNSKTRRGRKMESKANCLTSTNFDYNWYNGITYRKLTPRECFRLQTIPEPIIDRLLASGISNTQLYKIAGNGWTTEVIAHIFRGMTI